VNRSWVPRIAAPAAFLAGVTIAVVLVRGGFADDTPATTTVLTTAPTTTAAKKAKSKSKPKPKPVYARVEAGDTLDQIALENDTTVERLLELNPQLDPNSMQVGQQVRVR